MTGGLAKPSNRPRQISLGCSPSQDFTLTCPYWSSCSDSSWPHPFATAPRRNTPYITRYIRIRGETPATSLNGRLRLKRKMTVLCENLDALRLAEARAAVQIGIDTGRRPEDITGLPLDCLDHDPGGGAVLVYDNAKAGRLARRLPIGDATVAVIRAQQARVRARFPDTPPGELKLLPSPRANPDGRRPLSLAALEGRHRDWVDGLGALRTSDGAEFECRTCCHHRAVRERIATLRRRV